METLIQGKHLGPCFLLPALGGTCSECAVEHGPTEPHNQQSLYYQYHFYNEHGVWPTWGDALAHCDEKTRQLWESELLKIGVEKCAFKPNKP